MPLHFRCPCGVILNSPDGSAGRAAECPTCGKIIVIPSEAVSVALAELERPASSGAAAPAPEPEPVLPLPGGGTSGRTPKPVDPWSDLAPPATEPAEASESKVSTDVELRAPADLSEDDIEPAPAALNNGDSHGPEEVFGPAAAAKAPPSNWPLLDDDVKSEPTIMVGPGALEAAEAEEAEPLAGETTPGRGMEPLKAILPAEDEIVPVAEPVEELSELPDLPEPVDIVLAEEGPAPALPASVEEVAALMPESALSPGPARPKSHSGRKRSPISANALRSGTAVVRKRGRRALEALEAVDGGAERPKPKPKPKPRRRGPAPWQRSGRRRIIIFLVVVVLLGAACFAALLFVPGKYVPRQLHEQADMLRSLVKDLGVPVELIRKQPGAGDEADAESGGAEEP